MRYSLPPILVSAGLVKVPVGLVVRGLVAAEMVTVLTGPLLLLAVARLMTINLLMGEGFARGMRGRRVLRVDSAGDQAFHHPFDAELIENELVNEFPEGPVEDCLHYGTGASRGERYHGVARLVGEQLNHDGEVRTAHEVPIETLQILR